MTVWGYDFEGNPVKSAAQFDQLMGDPRRSLGYDVVVTPEGDEISISTVYLVTDHNWSGQGRPVLWETMTFIAGAVASPPRWWRDRRETRRRHNLWGDLQWRYDSAQAALEGHRYLVAVLTEGLPIDGLPSTQTIREESDRG